MSGLLRKRNNFCFLFFWEPLLPPYHREEERPPQNSIDLNLPVTDKSKTSLFGFLEITGTKVDALRHQKKDSLRGFEPGRFGSK
jgi:hypothetical protein